MLGGLCLLGVFAVATMWMGRAESQSSKSAYRSPLCVALSPDGGRLYASDRTAGKVVVIDTAQGKKVSEIGVQGQPVGVALSADGNTLYVAEYGAGTVAAIDTRSGKVGKRAKVGLRPQGVTVSGNRLFVCNRESHDVSVVDTATMKEVKRVRVVREPYFAAVTPDGSRLIVGNAMPHGVGIDPTLAAEVSIIGLAGTPRPYEVIGNVKLPAGSSIVRGVAASPDGKWAYVVHGLGRFNVPITQMERGWVNTFGMTIIDVAKTTRLATVLLDDLAEGAADPFGIVCSADGKRLFVSLGGVHQIEVINAEKLHQLLAGQVPQDVAQIPGGAPGEPNIWVRVSQSEEAREALADDLTALYIAGIQQRVPSGGSGPRGVALSPDGKKLYIAHYYTGAITVMDTESNKPINHIAVGAQPPADPVRKGEEIFNDATRAFQHWHSCASCHTDGRVDGLRWDFLNDGIGNAKDTLSLLNMDKMPLMNRRATGNNPRACVKGGLTNTHMGSPTEEDVDNLFAYLKSLKPEPSPHLVNGKLSPAAQRGKKIFEGKGECARCHIPPLFSDAKMHNVGVLSENEPDGRYVTPMLIEAYQTAPYLHDGRALTLKDVVTTFNQEDKHGKTNGLSPQEIDDLVAYLQSL